ncbi:MAG: hypothetical protein JWL82_56 [Parcubacteria group bacterium]|nr:hypothetical protein [Parcubacteria group bacterium]
MAFERASQKKAPKGLDFTPDVKKKRATISVVPKMKIENKKVEKEPKLTKEEKVLQRKRRAAEALKNFDPHYAAQATAHDLDTAHRDGMATELATMEQARQAVEKLHARALDKEVKALAQEYAISEKDPNSWAEYKAKLEALLDKHEALREDPFAPFQGRVASSSEVPALSEADILAQQKQSPEANEQGPMNDNETLEPPSNVIPMNKVEPVREPQPVSGKATVEGKPVMTPQEALDWYHTEFTPGPVPPPNMTPQESLDWYHSEFVPYQDRMRKTSPEAAPSVPSVPAEQTPVALNTTPEVQPTKKENGLSAEAAFRADDMRLAALVEDRERTYFAALKASQRSRGFMSAMGARLGIASGRDNDPVGQVAAFRKAWVEAREERTKAMLNSIETRREGRGGAARSERDATTVISKGPRRGKNYLDTVRARYQRMYVIKETAFGAEEAEQKNRSEGLRLRDNNFVEASMKAYNKLSPKQKIFVSGATGAALTTAGMFGGIVPMMIIGGMSASAAGINMAAELAKDKKFNKTGTVLNHVAKATTFGGVGGFFARVFGRRITKEEKAVAESKLKAQVHGDLRDSGAFASLSRERIQAAAKKEMLDNRVTTMGVAGSLAASVAGGAAVGAAFGHQPPSGAQSGHYTGPLGKDTASFGSGGGGGHAAEAPAGVPAAAEQAGVHATGPSLTNHSESISAHISYKGEGVDKLYADLREQISEAYRHAGVRPPVVEKMLEFKTMDEFSKATGFEQVMKGGDLHGAHGHVDSAVMHMEGNGLAADKLTLSADRMQVLYTDSHGAEHVLMQQTPQGEVFTYEQHVPMRDYSHTAGNGNEAAHASAAHKGDAAGDAKIAELNRAQLDTQADVKGSDVQVETAPTTPSVDHVRAPDEVEGLTPRGTTPSSEVAPHSNAPTNDSAMIGRRIS